MKRLMGAIAAFAVVTALGASGCTEGYKMPRLEGKWTDKPAAPAPAPRAATPTPAPAPAPAPKAAPSSGSVMYFPTGERSTSSIMLEKIAPSEVIAGQPFDYIIRVTNLTSLSLDNVVVTDTLSPNFKVLSSNPAAEGTYRWSLGTFKPGESKDIKISGQAASVQPLSSCATVTYTSSLCININVVQPSLKITKTATPEITVCDSIQYKITVSNPGTGMARGVKVRDQLPAGVTDAAGKSLVEFDAGDLAPGTSKDFTFAGKAAKPGTYANSAAATAAGGLTADSGPASTVVRQPVLTIKAECQGTIMQGRNATFKFTVCNTGDTGAASTVVTAPIPAGATFVSADTGGTASGTGVTWNLGTLAPKDCKTVSYTVRSSTAGDLKASATATATCAAQVSDSCTTGVKGVPDIGTQLDDDNGVVQVGETHVFHFEVRNQGQIDLTNVKVVFTLDDGLDFVSSAPIAGQGAGRTATINIGTLKIGQTVKVDVVGKGTKPGQFVIRGLTTSDQTRPVTNDEQVNYVER
ncbi:MAG: DUF11 domain-containing protein [Phycisphaerales bacterium]|nr:DUF11 domain-containing protein [Phycisphaerales bacterium]